MSEQAPDYPGTVFWGSQKDYPWWPGQRIPLEFADIIGDEEEIQEEYEVYEGECKEKRPKLGKPFLVKWFGDGTYGFLQPFQTKRWNDVKKHKESFGALKSYKEDMASTNPAVAAQAESDYNMYRKAKIEATNVLYKRCGLESKVIEHAAFRVIEGEGWCLRETLNFDLLEHISAEEKNDLPKVTYEPPLDPFTPPKPAPSARRLSTASADAGARGASTSRQAPPGPSGSPAKKGSGGMKRSTFSKDQIAKMIEVFMECNAWGNTLSKETKERVASEIGETYERVKNWFQNNKGKLKDIAKKDSLGDRKTSNKTKESAAPKPPTKRSKVSESIGKADVKERVGQVKALGADPLHVGKNLDKNFTTCATWLLSNHLRSNQVIVENQFLEVPMQKRARPLIGRGGEDALPSRDKRGKKMRVEKELPSQVIPSKGVENKKKDWPDAPGLRPKSPDYDEKNTTVEVFFEKHNIPADNKLKNFAQDFIERSSSHGKDGKVNVSKHTNTKKALLYFSTAREAHQCYEHLKKNGAWNLKSWDMKVKTVAEKWTREVKGKNILVGQMRRTLSSSYEPIKPGPSNYQRQNSGTGRTVVRFATGTELERRNQNGFVQSLRGSSIQKLVQILQYKCRDSPARERREQIIRDLNNLDRSPRPLGETTKTFVEIALNYAKGLYPN